MTVRSIYLPPYRIELDVRPGIHRVLPAIALARCLAAALQAGGAPEPVSAGLILADDRELARLNAAHLGKHGPTDVLSFPLQSPAAYPAHPGRPEGAEQGRTAPVFRLPPGVRLHLGEVVISVERAVAQAEGGRGGQAGDVRWAAADELRLLVVHGGLHLCGWDHGEPEEEAAMRALERAVLGLHDGGEGGVG